METVRWQYEYHYRNSCAGSHHTYLLAPLRQMLQRYRSSDRVKPRVLDLGCGNGSLTHQIARSGYEAIGVDISSEGIEIASKSFPDCQFIRADIYRLPEFLMDGSFDFAISVETIEHLTYPRELLRDARKCLRPGGRLIVTTPYHGYLKNLAIALLGRMDEHFTALRDGGHVKFFSIKTLSKLLESEGYSDLEFQFAGRHIPYLWKSMLCSARPVSADRD